MHKPEVVQWFAPAASGGELPAVASPAGMVQSRPITAADRINGAWCVCHGVTR
ncbi:hypothetical protein [Nocardia salmonicida]|uniref:hypothetical protein n=1 Tax=Nocardia salmonicida TaxID=53431 RepID=UPI0033C76AE6